VLGKEQRNAKETNRKCRGEYNVVYCVESV
jgi:hypothetical protein